MTTVLDLISDVAPTADDVLYVINDPSGTPGDRFVTVGNMATAIGGLLGVAFVATTGAQNVGGVKTFTSTPIIPDEVFGVGWNGKLEPPTKNAVYDQLVSLPTLDTTTPAAISIYTSSGVTYVDYLGAVASVFSDAVFTVQDNLDSTKQVRLELGGITPANLRTLTVPDLSGTLVLTTGAQLLTSKQLDAFTTIDRTRTVAAVEAYGVLTNLATVTLDYASPSRGLGTLYDAGVTIVNQTIPTATVSDVTILAARGIRNANGSALGLGLIRPFSETYSVVADAAAVTAQAIISYRAGLALSVTGGGTLAVAAAQAFGAAGTVGPGVTVTTYNVHASAMTNTGGTITTLAHYKANNITPTGGGVIGTMYGVNVDAILGATTLNMGMRLAAGLQLEPTARTIGVVGDTLVATAAAGNSVLAPRYELTNSTGGSLTLTSVPTLQDGAPGQKVEFLNVGAQNIVIQDQGTLAGSNLRLGATTRTLGPRDSIVLAWSTGIGDWVEDYFSNVL